MLKSFPKIFALGDPIINDIFSEEVEVTEKVDGSQFVFGKVDGQLQMRSKGKELFADAPEKMFKEAINYACAIEDKIPDNTVYYCEYLQKPKHNVLTYERIPQNHLILFGVEENRVFVSNYEQLQKHAEAIKIEVVPCLYKGRIDSLAFFSELLEKDSVLGNVKIEGVVIKNYNRRTYITDRVVLELMSGKYVSEKFKEKHAHNWKTENTGKGKWETYKESFRTEARWQKAVQHLKEKGELDHNPRDIGKLIVEIKKDVTEEEKENIKDFLWKEFGEELLRKVISGFPEWYKEQLAKEAFTQ